jgi:hypothetical protein
MWLDYGRRGLAVHRAGAFRNLTPRAALSPLLTDISKKTPPTGEHAGRAGVRTGAFRTQLETLH